MNRAINTIAYFVGATLLFIAIGIARNVSQENARLRATRAPPTKTVVRLVYAPRIPKVFGYIWPIHPEDWREGELTEPFGERSPGDVGGRIGKLHSGVDGYGVSHFGATWQARVITSKAGVIVELWPPPAPEWQCGRPPWSWKGHPEYGGYAAVWHPEDGSITHYAHQSELVECNEGARVEQGQLLGRQGNTGNSEGSHVHFALERLVGGVLQFVNPLVYIDLPEAAGAVHQKIIGGKDANSE